MKLLKMRKSLVNEQLTTPEKPYEFRRGSTGRTAGIVKSLSRKQGCCLAWCTDVFFVRPNMNTVLRGIE
jgi:hypothetical protein